MANPVSDVGSQIRSRTPRPAAPRQGIGHALAQRHVITQGEIGQAGGLTNVLGLGSFNGTVPGFSTQGASAADLSTDPILAKIQAASAKAVADAQVNADAQRRALALASGDHDLALALTGDETLAEAAAKNPFGTAEIRAQQNQQNVRATNEATNKSNLFYSSEAGRRLGLVQQAYLQQQAADAQDFWNKAGNITTGLLAAEQNAADQNLQGESDAYARLISSGSPYTAPVIPPAGGFQAPPTKPPKPSAKPPKTPTGNLKAIPV